MRTAEKIFIHVLIGSLMVPIMLGALWFLWPKESAITFTGIHFARPKYVAAGNHVTIYREFTITRPIKVYIYRSLVRDEGNRKTRVPLTTITEYFLAGDYYYSYPIRLPCELTPGQWILENVSTHEDKYGRTVSIASPPIPINITASCLNGANDD